MCIGVHKSTRVRDIFVPAVAVAVAAGAAARSILVTLIPLLLHLLLFLLLPEFTYKESKEEERTNFCEGVATI